MLTKNTVQTYRYGFNGKTNDNEAYSVEGSFQDYGMRVNDTRLARFLSVDPLTSDYPWYTPYQFAGNKPIESIDLDGMEEFSTKKGDVTPTTKMEYKGSITDKVGALLYNGTVGTLYNTASSAINLATNYFKDPVTTVAKVGESVDRGLKSLSNPITLSGSLNSFTKWENYESAITIGLTGALSKLTSSFAGYESTSSTTLYRGINESHPGYSDALKGNAKPRGGNATAVDHTAGNTKSIHTSWTTNFEVAKNYALRPNGSGVVLKMTTNKAIIVNNTTSVVLKQSGKLFSESEVLWQGVVRKSEIIKIK